MDLSEFMNIILGGGLVGTVATIGSLRATVSNLLCKVLNVNASIDST